MAQFFKNAMPQNYALGINDKSTRPAVFDPEELPTHLPKVYIWAADGPTEPQLVAGSTLTSTYGQISFDPIYEYFNHATLFLTEMNGAGNAAMVERLKPDDAGPNASLRVYLELLPSKVDEYERNVEDGSLVLDANGDPKPTGTKLDGYQWMIVAEPFGDKGFKQATIKAGVLVDADTQEQGKRYPIFDLEVPHFGKGGNNAGFQIYTPDVNSQQGFDDALMRATNQYPVRIAAYKRENQYSVGRIQSTLTGDSYVDGVLRKGTINPRTGGLAGVENLFIKAYELLNDQVSPNIWGPFGKFHVYQDYVDTVQKLLIAAEKPYTDLWSDWTTGEEDEAGLFNFLGGHSSQGVPYHTYVQVKNHVDSVILTQNSVMYASGGSDGTMNDTVFAKLVGERISEYNNPLSPLMNGMKYPESIFYDSGFPFETKKKLFNFIARRKDTFLVMTTHDVNGPDLSASEESSMGLSLKTFAKLYPESEFYGTPVARVMVVPGSGDYTRSTYDKRMPFSLEIALKSARYMGAGNGIWNAAYRFSGAPGSILEYFVNPNNDFKPVQVRNTDWDNGLVSVQSKERKTLFFPAFKTVYDNDTSVLNSFFTAMACVELQKIGDRAWTDISGVDYLDELQIIERNNQNILDRVAGRFDDRFKIVPETYYTKDDSARGYSFHHKIKIYAANMTTVAVFTVEAYRISDYVEA